MDRFLAQSAAYIFKKHSTELHKVCLVFPNRRAGVFFTSYLQNEITKPAIAPEINTIGELFTGYSNYFQAEKLQLISLLFDEFRKHTQTTETFDQFYFWGEILLADFNDIDRYFLDARDLFTNVADLKEIDLVFDYLTDEQKAALEQFWGSVAVAGRKDFQQKHLLVWSKLFAVYAGFKSVLKEGNLAFPGMADRQVVEEMEAGKLEFGFEKYYFIGLNALNECEKRLFNHLIKEQKAAFLWDYDSFYTGDKTNEAGRFMRDNLLRFPPPVDFVVDNNHFSKPKKIKLVAVSSNYGQAQQVPIFLDEIKQNEHARFDETAVVLADETLLFPALGAVPAEVGIVNITMGYPVKNSMIHGLLMLLVQLMKNRRVDANGNITAYYRYVTDILNHQLLTAADPEKSRLFVSEIQSRNKISITLTDIQISPLHRQIFTLPVSISDYCCYFLGVLSEIFKLHKADEEHDSIVQEVIISVYGSIEKLNALIKKVVVEQQREISDTVFFRLLTQYLNGESVAFEGEPLAGLQMMGILETRCLDFKNLVILGLNENKWPRTSTAPSFIPANIRKGFGLPGIDEQDAMYAYYFYRLIQRAENITATYNVIKDGIGTGELSRYGYQLLFDSPHEPEKINLGFSFARNPVQPIEVKATPDIARQLLEYNQSGKALSPSAINTYLQCSLRFYFRYIAQLPEPEEVKEEIDGAIFGTIFHETLEELYQPFVGKTVTWADIEKILETRLLTDNLLLQKIRTVYLKQPDKKGELVPEGKTALFFENMKTYLHQLLKTDAKYAPFQIVSLEKGCHSKLEVNIDGEPRQILIGGKIDRVDRVNGTLRILDYKTGNVSTLSFKSIAELFASEKKDPKKEILQALVYALILADETGEQEVKPVIYSLRKLFDEKFNPNIRFENAEFSLAEIRQELVEHLKSLLAEIFSANNKFAQTPFPEHCKYCAYSKICMRY
jgi:CRISPR/Cas system-associated exonuclease Cas4 (RecB family)